MYIVYGTRAYFRKNKVVRHGYCQFCNQFGKLQSYDARRFFHVYYIPMIPTEGARRNHDICSNCEQGVVYEPAAYEHIVNTLKEKSADALMALKNGEATIPADDSGEPVNCVAYLHSVVDWLYAANDREFCESMLGQLNDPRLRFAQAMTKAAIETAQGSIDDAISTYQTAIQAEPKSIEALRGRAQLLGNRKRYDECIESYKAACAVADNDTKYALMLELVDFQTAAKQHPEAAATFDWLLQANPELLTNKKFMKLVNTARKKAGIK